MAHPATPGWQLAVTPVDALIDEARVVRVSGLPAGATVRLSTETVRGAGVRWRSTATFVADADGVVDTAQQAPISGDYSGVSALGLLWSQQPEDSDSRELFLPEAAPLLTTVVAEVAGDTQAVPLVQRLAGAGVSRRDVREDGLVGTLFLPAGPGPHPAVMVLNGSGGGINEPRAALYASRGYAAFALGYFKAPGLSNYISNTPLEYFKRGLDWLRRTVQPAHDFVALSGQSRGGELVLLLGTVFAEDVSAVIAYVPGAVVHGGQNAADPAVGRDGAAWLLNGEPVPYVWQNNRTASWAPWDDGPTPRRHANAVLTALDDPEAVARARIPVEQIRGPVLVLSGTDDGSWPSSRYGRMVMDSLREHAHPHARAHLDYEGVGHAILFPHVPTTQIAYAHPVSGRISTGGGTPALNAQANADSWPDVRRFLDAAVQARASRGAVGV